jgi:hypothetical protein
MIAITMQSVKPFAISMVAGGMASSPRDHRIDKNRAVMRKRVRNSVTDVGSI